jgi:hypothetical protein
MVFINEIWVKTNTRCAHGRCPGGQRLIAKVPYGALTFVVELRRDGMVAHCVLRLPSRRLRASRIVQARQVCSSTVEVDRGRP